jgi:acyl dehydratase|tara:strand:+ start:131 stop:559 length:429 start_codon:yes stop_codon:yes gene_type:complete
MSRKSANYKFDDITIGLTKEFSIEITESMVDNFAEFSGDYNELHMDEDYASTTSFGKRICHGMLLTSFFSRLVGMSIPGKNALYFSQSINFQSPCFIGDRILIRGEVTEKSESTHIITIKTTILNQDSKCLIDGIAKVIVQN